MSLKKLKLSLQVSVRRVSNEKQSTFEESNKQNACEISHSFSSHSNENKTAVLLSTTLIYIHSPLHECFVQARAILDSASEAHYISSVFVCQTDRICFLIVNEICF